MQERDAGEVGGLYRAAGPQTIFAKMGDRFTARFMRWVDQQQHSQVKAGARKSRQGATLQRTIATASRPALEHAA